MLTKLILLLFLIGFLTDLKAQEAQKKYAVGVCYGGGSGFDSQDYRFANHYFKGQFNYKWRSAKRHQWELFVQPELNFASHQLLNKYFVTPDVADYEEKRVRFTKMQHIHEYILSLGFLYRQLFSERFGLYAGACIGPMITDTETERLSKGFAFSESLLLGVSYDFKGLIFNFGSGLRHSSNAGIQLPNAGFNTLNFEGGVLIPI